MTKFVTKQVGKIFKFNSSNAIYHSINVQISDNQKQDYYPYVVRSSQNNGIKGYIKEPTSGLNPGNTISLAQDTAQFFYQDQPYFTGNKVKVLTPINFVLNKETALYLISVMDKAFSGFSWGSNYSVDNLKPINIQVPVTPSGELDTEYMASYVQKIEASYVQKIEAYLAVLGYKSLADCQLNQHDLDVLHVKPKMKKFKVENLLYKIELKWHGDHKFDKLADTSESKTKEFNLPLLNAKHGNNGIMFYGRKDEWDQAKNIIDVVSNGAVATGDVYFQTNNISVMWDAYALDAKQTVSAKAKEYIATSLKKVIKLIFGWENKAVWSKVRNIKITLPVTSSGTPDWQFMEDYITAIEKLKVLKIKQFLDTKINAYQNIIK